MGDFTFLEDKQILDYSEQLQIFKKYGTKAAITDFALLLGGACKDSSFVNDSKSLKDRTGYYYTGTFKRNFGVHFTSIEDEDV